MRRVTMERATLLAVAFALSPAAAATAQTGGADTARQGPRFLIASAVGSASVLVPVDVERIPVLSRRLALNLEGVTLKEALNAISALSGLELLYGDDVLPLDRRVHLRAETITVAAALTDVLLGTGVDVVFNRERGASLVKRAARAPVLRRDSLATVDGRVTGRETGEPIAGALVSIAGTPLHATTDNSGWFLISNAPTGQRSITARYIGYRPVTKKVGVDSGSVRVNFALEAQPTRLEDLITTATGEQRRVELGNAITVIRVDSVLRTAPIKDLTDLLESRVPGLAVQPTTGAPGDPSRLRLRGIGSALRSNDPIVFVDGVRVYAAQSVARAGNLANSAVAAPSPLDQIDPNSIEKVEVFKGPSAATAYGADAANGVFVVTTKRGRAGPTRWDASITRGRSQPATQYPLGYFRWGHDVDAVETPMLCPVTDLTCVQDSLVRYQALNDPQVSPFGTGHRTGLSLSASGGSEVLTYAVTGTYNDETGLVALPGLEIERFRAQFGKEPPDWMRRPHQLLTWGLTSNFTARLGERADVTLFSRVSRTDQQRSSLESQNSLLARTYVDKVNGIYYEPGIGRPSEGTTGFFNRSGQLLDEYYQKTTASAVNVATQVEARWRPRSWLNTYVRGGLNVIPRDDQALIPAGLREQISGDTLGRFARGTGRSVVGDVHVGGSVRAPLLGGFDVQLGVGADLTNTTEDDLISSAVGLSPGTNSLNGASQITVTESRISTTSFGWWVEPQLHHHRFSLSTGLRLDGGSTYGSRAKLSGMPKINGTWLISDEPFFPFKRLVPELRLRAGYGHAGVQPGVTDRLRLFTTRQERLDGRTVTNVELATLGNTEVRPERSTEIEGGFDAQLLDRRLSIELTGYRKTRKDALMAVPLPPSIYGSLAPTVLKNIGVIRNSGMELTLGVVPIRSSALTWHATLNVSWNDNKVIELGPGVAPFSIGTANDIAMVAEGYPVAGRWAKPIVGFADQNGDGVLQSSEVAVGDSLMYMGQLLPDQITSLFTTVSLLDGAVAINAGFSYEHGATQVDRSSSWVLSRALADPTAPLQDQAAVIASDRTEYGLIRGISTFRFQSFSVSYRAPEPVARFLGARHVSLALQGSNLGVRSTYGGRDPDVSAWTSGETIFDSGQLAQPRDWQLRLDVSY